MSPVVRKVIEPTSGDWALDLALKVIRLIQPKIRNFGYHCALGGGVLNKGYSTKDLDLYMLPLVGTPDPMALRTYLSTVLGTEYTLGGPAVRTADVDSAYPPEPIWVSGRFTYRDDTGLRTDVFIA